MSDSINNDPGLLEIFVQDMEGQSDVWKPTNYWKVNFRRIKHELDRVGLNGFRRNWNLIKGYGNIPTLKRAVLGNSKKSKLLNLFTYIPPFNLIRNKYELFNDRLISDSALNTQKQNALLYYLLSEGKYSNPILLKVEDSCVGNPISYEFNGRKYTSNILHQIFQLSLLFHSEGSSNSFKKILEIGGGYGALPEILFKFHDGEIDYFVAVDIPPLVYITTQYLKAVFPGKVIDYREIRNMKTITESDIQGKILVIPPWVLPSLNIEFDLFWNSASFQEMEYNIVENYLDFVSKKAKNIFINTLIEGHKKGVGGQDEPITFQWISNKIVSMGYNQQQFTRSCVEKSAFNTELSNYSIGFFKKTIQD